MPGVVATPPPPADSPCMGVTVIGCGYGIDSQCTGMGQTATSIAALDGIRTVIIDGDGRDHTNNIGNVTTHFSHSSLFTVPDLSLSDRHSFAKSKDTHFTRAIEACRITFQTSADSGAGIAHVVQGGAIVTIFTTT